jgi:hypothetical protein
VIGLIPRLTRGRPVEKNPADRAVLAERTFALSCCGTGPAESWFQEVRTGLFPGGRLIKFAFGSRYSDRPVRGDRWFADSPLEGTGFAKAQFRSLAEPWADTGTSTGRLMLAVLGGLADVERDLIRTRTAEGRSRAKARGKHMGRPPSLERGHQTARAGRDVAGIGRQLRPQHCNHAPRHAWRLRSAYTSTAA